MRITQQSGWSLPEALQPSSGNFMRPLIFGRYIVNECHDVMCDVTAPHVHRSRNLLL